MKELTLYIDRWYIIGAICTDGVAHLIELPNHEDRFWLFFYEDVNNDCVIYGKDNERHWRDRESHYYGNIFSLITNPNSKFVFLNEPCALERIFQSSGMFDVMKLGCNKNLKDLPIYISFSEDITDAEKLVFLNILEKNDFHVKESVAHIEHLALEHGFRHNHFQDNGYFLTLNACNENLHYSLYKHAEGVFVRVSEKVLSGYGSDLRGRSLIETIVESINRKNGFLKTKEEKEEEYLRLNLFVNKWLDKLNDANSIIPVVIPDVTFSKQPYNKFSVPIIKKKLDEHTKVKVDRVIMEVTSFVKDSNVRNEEVRGVLFIGNTFTNSQYKQSIREKFLIEDEKFVILKDTDLPNVVGVYSVMDCSQFSVETITFKEKSEQELLRLQNAISEAEKIRKAKEEEKQKQIEIQKIQEEERRYKNIKDKILNFEKHKDFSQMKEWCEKVLKDRSNDDFAKNKLYEANQKIAEESALTKQYNTQIILANNSFREGRWADALSQSSAALSMRQTAEAKRINEESSKKLNKISHIKDYLNRADAFASTKSYEEALIELQKVLELDNSNREAMTRKSQIDVILSKINKTIKELEEQEIKAEEKNDYDLAMDICNKLIDSDIKNVKKWTVLFQSLKVQKDNLDKIKKEVNRINKEIENATSSNDWEKVIKLCQSGINIQQNAVFEEKIKNAEDKLQKLVWQTKIAKIQEQIIEANSQQNWQVILDFDNEYPQLRKDKVYSDIIQNAKNQRRIKILEKRKKIRTMNVPKINVDQLDGINITGDENKTNEFSNFISSTHNKNHKPMSDVIKNEAITIKRRFPNGCKRDSDISSIEERNESTEQTSQSLSPKRKFPRPHRQILDDLSIEERNDLVVEQTSISQSPKRIFPRPHRQILDDSSIEERNDLVVEQTSISQSPKRIFPRPHRQILDDSSIEEGSESVEQTSLSQSPKRKFPKPKGKN